VSDDEADAPDGAAARLTIGQRLLTALPNLQRAPAPPAPDRSAPGRSTPGRSTPGRSTGRGRSGERGHDLDATDAGEDEVLASDADADDGDEHTAATAAGARGRRSAGNAPTGGRKRPVDIADSLSREEIVHMIKKVDDRERFMALFAAPLGVVVGVALTAIAIHVNPAVRVHGKLNPKHVAESVILIEGGARILLSGIVVAAAMSRRRSLIGFALLFLGTSMGSPLFALPFWALGGYLIWRVFKYQRALNARGGATGRGATPAPRSGTTGTARGGRATGGPRTAARAGAAKARDRTAARQRGRKQPEPAGPARNKRYTPPKPTRPRPPAPSS